MASGPLWTCQPQWFMAIGSGDSPIYNDHSCHIPTGISPNEKSTRLSKDDESLQVVGWFFGCCVFFFRGGGGGAAVHQWGGYWCRINYETIKSALCTGMCFNMKWVRVTKTWLVVLVLDAKQDCLVMCRCYNPVPSHPLPDVCGGNSWCLMSTFSRNSSSLAIGERR